MNSLSLLSLPLLLLWPKLKYLSPPSISSALFGPLTLIHCSHCTLPRAGTGIMHVYTQNAHTDRQIYKMKHSGIHWTRDTKHVLDHGRLEVVTLGPLWGKSVANQNHMWLTHSLARSRGMWVSGASVHVCVWPRRGTSAMAIGRRRAHGLTLILMYLGNSFVKQTCCCYTFTRLHAWEGSALL